MFLISCPYCGERDQVEFTCGGEAHIARPKNPSELSDDQWAEYLFLRKNEKCNKNNVKRSEKLSWRSKELYKSLFLV